MPTEPKQQADHKNIHIALAAFQQKVPRVAKDSSASVKTKTGGNYSYTYASLDVVIQAVIPALAAEGIAWVAIPTYGDGPRFHLRYGLYHGKSDTCIEGSYPLPDGSAPQEMASAITYARRYTLMSLAGVFPEDEDDDGAAAHVAAARGRARPSNQQNDQRDERPQGGGGGPMHMPSPPDPPSPAPKVTRAEIEAVDRIEGLRDVYRKASAANQLDEVLDTGEAVRDAITARRLVLEEKVAVPESPQDVAAELPEASDGEGADREKAVAAALDQIGKRE